MKTFDICLAWNWEYDGDFARILESACKNAGLSFLQITPDNLDENLKALSEENTRLRIFIDRASDTDDRFVKLNEWARECALFRINPREKELLTLNKSRMHELLKGAGLDLPETIILAPYNENQSLPEIDINSLGENFIIKPACGGGGEGVKLRTNSLNEVAVARKEHPSDMYLLQSMIVPANLNKRKTWFRVIYCAGQVYPCWWDPGTHEYHYITDDEESYFNLGRLREIAASIYDICELEIFSTEVALTIDNRFVVIDYVNDQIDLRVRSKALDGVPDHIVKDIAANIVCLAMRYCRA